MARALAALPEYPVHAQARERLRVAITERSAGAQLAAIVRSDAGLAVAALRAAAGELGDECGAERAVEVLGAERLG
ncbi:MAG TPA: hypothetical protein VF517_15620, partial [Thermoleophilaceae bacterium]